MPQVRDVRSVAGATTIANVMTGSPFERVGGRGARIKVYIRTDAAIANVPLTNCTVLLGSDTIVRAGNPNGAGTGQVATDTDLFAEGFAAPGDPITVELVNATAATAVVYSTLVSIENL